MRRTLVLDEDDLLMVVKEDIVKQIDEHRGEMNRTEFVNYLIQCQMKEQLNQKNSISKEEFQQYKRQTLELMRNMLEIFISSGMSMDVSQHSEDIQTLSQQLESFQKLSENTES
jgi:hypothetical protein